MSTVEKVAMGVIGVAMATTLVLPGRQTSQIIASISGLFRGSLATAMASPRR
ncbi:MAG TPA: hypothetical protein VFY14_06970 [Streptomyces sp.]|jgi:hypothetical protein|nr:hypothetical protein [Streptomyces sp.]